jgi:hypothetical protein
MAAIEKLMEYSRGAVVYECKLEPHASYLCLGVPPPSSLLNRLSAESIDCLNLMLQ